MKVGGRVRGSAGVRGLTPSTWESLTSVSSLLRLSGSCLVTGSRRTGWPETEEGEGRSQIRETVTFTEDRVPAQFH